jgi:uncharacterized membrane protein
MEDTQDKFDYTHDSSDYIALTPNAQLISSTWADMNGYWGVAIGAFLLLILVSVLSFIIPLGGLVIGGPLALGMAILSLNISRQRNAQVNQIFEGFNQFGTAIGAYLLMLLIVLLFLLLFIIPGIIAALYLSQTMYVIADNRNISVVDALKESKRLMEGNKAKLFRLMLRFAGLSFLCLLTLGIGYFWLIPLQNVTFARFYEDISGNKGEQPRLLHDDLIDQI